MTQYFYTHGWTIHAERFSAPVREGFHYYGDHSGETYVGPLNSAEEVWQDIQLIRAEVREGWTKTDSRDYAEELERASVIALARKLDPATLDAEACAAGPGKYEGADDLALVVALDILSGHGCADEQAGSTEWGLHLARFGRYVLSTDSQGFVSCARFNTEELAQAELTAEYERQDNEYFNEFRED